jgi:hypothetical protein
MTTQRRSRLLDVLTAEHLSAAATRVLETAFWFPRPSEATEARVVDLAARRVARIA